MNDKSSTLGALLVPFAIIIAGVMVAGAIFVTQKGTAAGDNTTDDSTLGTDTEADPTDGSFSYKADYEIYKIDGKPVVALVSTDTCPHCIWVKDTFDKVAKEYNDSGKVKAYHFEYKSDGTLDDLLTEASSDEMPSELDTLTTEMSGGYVPTFIIGGKYYRVGNAYESTSDLVKEEEELRRIIEKVIAEAK